MSIEAMKQALEAMGLMGADLICEAAHHGKKDRHGIGEPCHIQQRWHKAFDALRTAIAEAEKQEPVAWQEADYDRVLQVIKEMRPAAEAIKDKPASWWLDRFEEAVKQLKERA